jgi:phage shock protein A
MEERKMAILKRIRDIVNANINDMLDKVEDPEKMVNQIIRDMDQAILDMRREAASSIATRKMLEKKLAKTKADHEQWEENAKSAIENGEDNLAMKALEKRNSLAEKVKSLEEQANEADELAATLKENVVEAEEKVQEFRRKRETLISKKRAAETRKKLMDSAERAGKGLSSLDSSANAIINGFDSFERLEEKIDRQTAEIEARKELAEELDNGGIEKKFEKRKKDKKLEEDLRALKKSMGKM